MAFATVLNYIYSLDANDEITLEVLFGLFSAAMDDTKAVSESGSVSSVRIGDEDNYIKRLIAVINMIEQANQTHNIDFSSISTRRKEKYEKLSENIRKACSESEGLEKQIEDASKKQDELTEIKSKLEQERGHLLHIKQDCEAIQAGIDRLNDPYLDGLAQEKEELEKQASALQEKERALIEEIQQAKDALSEIETQHRQSENELAETRKEHERLAVTIEQNKEIKAGLEKGIENQKKEVDAFQNWQKDFERRNRELNDTVNQISSLVRACDSLVKNDSFVKDVADEKGIGFFLSDEDKNAIIFDGGNIRNIQDLAKYLDSLKVRVDSLMELYQRVFAGFQKQSESILKTDSKNA